MTRRLAGSERLSSVAWRVGSPKCLWGPAPALLVNIVLGIVGAALAGWLLGLLGVGLGGWLGYLIAGFIGACILIALWRLIQGRRV